MTLIPFYINRVAPLLFSTITVFRAIFIPHWLKVTNSMQCSSLTFFTSLGISVAKLPRTLLRSFMTIRSHRLNRVGEVKMRATSANKGVKVVNATSTLSVASIVDKHIVLYKITAVKRLKRSEPGGTKKCITINTGIASPATYLCY